MNERPENDEEDLDVLPLDLDRDTRRRLRALSQVVGLPERVCARKLFRDLLRDDEFENVNALQPMLK